MITVSLAFEQERYDNGLIIIRDKKPFRNLIEGESGALVR